MFGEFTLLSGRTSGMGNGTPQENFFSLPYFRTLTKTATANIPLEVRRAFRALSLLLALE
jgi:hypothetical protein